MIALYKTNKMEETARALDAAHDRVMVRAIHKLRNPIRLRVKQLQDIRPFYARNDPAFDAEVERWKEECGTLINYRTYNRMEPVYDYDACMLCEAPLSVDYIEKLAKGAKSLCVIYHPPIWRAHEELLFAAYPTGKSCKRLVQVIESIAQSKDLAAIALACGIPTAGTRAAADDDLAKELGLSQPDLSIVRKRAFRSQDGRRYAQVIQLIPRVEPEDKTLLGVYQFIKDELPSVGHVRLARDNALSKAARFWKIALRALVRSGSVQQKGKTAFYFVDGLRPDYDRIQIEHETAKGKFTRLMAEVDSLPEFRAQSAPLLPKVSRAQSESEAHSDDSSR